MRARIGAFLRSLRGEGYGRFAGDPWAPFKWTATVAGLVVLNGLGGLAVGIILGIELVLGGSPRRLLALAMPCFAGVLLWNLWRGLPSDQTLSSLWVLDNPAAHQLAFAGFTFLVAGLLISPHRPTPGGPPRSPSPGSDDDAAAVQGPDAEPAT